MIPNGRRAGVRDPRPQGAARALRRPPVGRGQEPRGRSSASRPRLPWPVLAGGRDARGDDARRWRSSGVRALGPPRAAGPRVVAVAGRDLRAARRATSRSASPCSRRRSPAARSCSATSRACARTGTGPRCSSIPATTPRSAAALRRLCADDARRRSLAANARDRARAFGPRAHGRGLPGRVRAGCSRGADLGGAGMRVVIFCHSLLSDWNHGNAHFLRGRCDRAGRARARGPRLRAARRLERDEPGARARRAAARGGAHRFPDAASGALRGALARPRPRALARAPTLVLVHEWNEPELVRAIGRQRARQGGFALLFHDTHHRAVTDPAR